MEVVFLFKSPHLFKARLFSQAILENLQSEADQLEKGRWKEEYERKTVDDYEAIRDGFS